MVSPATSPRMIPQQPPSRGGSPQKSAPDTPSSKGKAAEPPGKAQAGMHPPAGFTHAQQNLRPEDGGRIEGKFGDYSLNLSRDQWITLGRFKKQAGDLDAKFDVREFYKSLKDFKIMKGALKKAGLDGPQNTTKAIKFLNTFTLPSALQEERRWAAGAGSTAFGVGSRAQSAYLPDVSGTALGKRPVSEIDAPEPAPERSKGRFLDGSFFGSSRSLTQEQWGTIRDLKNSAMANPTRFTNRDLNRLQESCGIPHRTISSHLGKSEDWFHHINKNHNETFIIVGTGKGRVTEENLLGFFQKIDIPPSLESHGPGEARGG